MEQNGCDLIIHDHDRDLCVTMVGWMDVGVIEVCQGPVSDILYHSPLLDVSVIEPWMS